MKKKNILLFCALVSGSMHYAMESDALAEYKQKRDAFLKEYKVENLASEQEQEQYFNCYKEAFEQEIKKRDRRMIKNRLIGACCLLTGCFCYCLIDIPEIAQVLNPLPGTSRAEIPLSLERECAGSVCYTIGLLVCHDAENQYGQKQRLQKEFHKWKSIKELQSMKMKSE